MLLLAVGPWLAGVLLGGYLLSVAVLVPWVLLKKTVHPTAVVAWIGAIILLPYLGAIVCVLLGANRVRRREMHKRAAAEAFAGQRERIEADLSVDAELPERWREVARLTEQVGGHPVVGGNTVEPVEDTSEAFAMLEQAIRGATSFVHIQFYIFRSDDVGKGVRDLLIDAAKRGVTVRFQYDGFGSIGLDSRFLRPLKEAGVSVATFLPGQTFRERWSMNLRSHRKIVIVDGEVALTGGVNVGDEYLGRSRNWGDWTDAFVRLRGPVVGQLQEVFAEDWYYATQQTLAVPEPQQGTAGGDVPAQAVASGPADRIEALPLIFTAAIAAARERVTLATGYFVPTEPLHLALQSASLRGVSVRVLTAGASTYFFTREAGRSFYEPLLEAGVEIHEYRKGLYHSKLLAADEAWAFIGSPNYDARSMALNFEIGVNCYGPAASRWVHDQVQADLPDACRVDPRQWAERSTRRRLMERSARLLAPVL